MYNGCIIVGVGGGIIGLFVVGIYLDDVFGVVGGRCYYYVVVVCYYNSVWVGGDGFVEVLFDGVNFVYVI